MQAQAPDRPGPVNINWGPGPVNTNWGSGPVNTNWRPGPVNTNCGPGSRPGLGSQQRVGGREIQIPALKSFINQNNLNITLSNLIQKRSSLKVRYQKQPFSDVIQTRCSQRFCNIHWKTSVLESLQACKLIKKDSNTSASL